MAKRVLVTGGAGFIGYHITKQLVEKGWIVRVFDNLIRGDKKKLENWIKEGKVEFVEGDIRFLSRLLDACHDVEAIFHQAADCINKSLQNPAESFSINVMGTTNVFEAARLSNIKKVIFASSASVYGDPDKLPITEEAPIKPITPYCIGKLAGEEIAGYYARYHDIDYIGFRYFNVYGPRQNIDAYYTNVVILFLKRIINDLSPLIDGEGKQSMDFIHVEDIARANVLALEQPVKNEIFNLGTNRATTIAKLASLLLRSSGKENIAVEFTGKKSIVRERRADYSKAERMLGWQPLIPVEEGIEELVQDIINNPSLYE
ncbi:MAG: NAD-dependent epimerase/dehydratase family protein [Candidatus Cloacimonetes bacterium]|nr:NAD-dependent epimerase/dehydratase family protein [Candidatus Cloacimonadota bacterium]